MEYVRIAGACFVVLLTGACAHQAPVEQVQLFQRAFVNVQSASQPLLDEVAVAERQRGRANAVVKARRITQQPATAAPAVNVAAAGVQPAATFTPSGGKDPHACESPWRPLAAKTEGETFGYITGFCNDDASFNSELRDPPLTHAYRTGITALGRYSELLVILAEGRNIEAAQAQMERLAASLSSGVAFIPGAQAAAAAVPTAVKELAPVIKAAAQEKNYEELKRVAVQQRPQFTKLTQELQANAPELFRTLIFSSEQEITRNLDNRKLLEAQIATVNGYRKVVSDLVVLLLELDEAHGSLVAALEREQPPSLAVTAERAQRLTFNAEALRQSFVVLRRGTAQ